MRSRGLGWYARCRGKVGGLEGLSGVSVCWSENKEHVL